MLAPTFRITEKCVDALKFAFPLQLPFGAPVGLDVSEEAGESVLVQEMDMERRIGPEAYAVAIPLIAIMEYQKFGRGNDPSELP